MSELQRVRWEKGQATLISLGEQSREKLGRKFREQIYGYLPSPSGTELDPDFGKKVHNVAKRFLPPEYLEGLNPVKGSDIRTAAYSREYDGLGLGYSLHVDFISDTGNKAGLDESFPQMAVTARFVPAGVTILETEIPEDKIAYDLILAQLFRGERITASIPDEVDLEDDGTWGIYGDDAMLEASDWKIVSGGALYLFNPSAERREAVAEPFAELTRFLSDPHNQDKIYDAAIMIDAGFRVQSVLPQDETLESYEMINRQAKELYKRAEEIVATLQVPEKASQLERLVA